MILSLYKGLATALGPAIDAYLGQRVARGKENEVITQYSMEPLTDLGMLKMDFLGLKTLTVIRDAEELIRREEPAFDIEKVPVDDQAAFDVLNRGETVGIFQFEGGMSRYCRNFGFTSLDDMNALCALYRPGPMALIPDYIKRKKGQTKINYDHPLLEKVAKETYGILIYQEQVQQAAMGSSFRVYTNEDRLGVELGVWFVGVLAFGFAVGWIVAILFGLAVLTSLALMFLLGQRGI